MHYNTKEVSKLSPYMDQYRQKRGLELRKVAEASGAAVVLLSMRTVAFGVMLTMANVVVFFELGLNIALERQAVNREHRIGQTRLVEKPTYVTKGTVDERILMHERRWGRPGLSGTYKNRTWRVSGKARGRWDWWRSTRFCSTTLTDKEAL